MNYETVAAWSQMISLIMFLAMFFGILVYALWPSNQKIFDAVQRDALDLGEQESDTARGQ